MLSTTLLLVACAAVDGATLQSTLDAMRREQQVPGVSAVITIDDRIAFTGASGVADIETGRAMAPDTTVYSGSLSKVFTAVLTLNLVDGDRLTLEQTIDGLAGRDDIRIRHLLTHASGLEREGDFGYWFSGRFPDTGELKDYLDATRLRFEPGDGLSYSNVGFAALGLLIEDTTGDVYAIALRDRVLEPLEMRSSGAPGPSEGIAIGYTPVGRIIPNADRPFAGVGRKVGDRHIREYHDAAAMSPAFGIYTTAEDMGRLLRFLLGHGDDDVLSATMRERMRSDQHRGWGFGLGIANLDGRTVARHDGWFAAHRSHLILDIDNGMGVAVLTNSDSARPARIAEALLEVALDGSRVDVNTAQ